MEKQYKVGIVGATGMVGQRFVTLLENHPLVQADRSGRIRRSAGKTYEEAVGPRWAMTSPMPESVKKMVVLDASKVEEVASQVDFIFCAVNMPKDEIKALEEAYAKAECPVVSNNSANRFTPDVPMVVPEINADHIEIIPAQRKRLGTKRGFIAVKSNCSLQSYVPALHPLMKDFGVSKALVCTYQAISGAGKTFDRMPEIVDNVIPYIGGEEEKSEREPLKLWGHIEGDQIVNAEKPVITAQCFRVPVSDGHTAAVFVSFEKKPTKGADFGSMGKLPRPRTGAEPAQRTQAVPALLHRAGSSRSPSWTATPRTAWPCASAVCARTPCLITSSPA